MEGTHETASSLRRASLPCRIWRFYADGFRSMTIGKTLWLIILIKLFILFAIMKVFFFPDILKRDFSTDEQRADFVRERLMK